MHIVFGTIIQHFGKNSDLKNTIINFRVIYLYLTTPDHSSFVELAHLKEKLEENDDTICHPLLRSYN
jgi:hypothetical protein